MPNLVTRLCRGLFMICEGFCKRGLNAVFDEIEASILKETNRPNNFEAHSEQRTFLNDIKRERENITTIFLQSLDARLSAIRNPVKNDLKNNLMPNVANFGNLKLVENEQFEKKQLFSSIVARSEAHNNTQLYSLRQRFAVLSGKPPFTNEELPLGPNAFCECLLDSIQALNFNIENTETIVNIFERRMLENLGELIEKCNHFLVEHKVLTNLNYVALRNPELRFKKSVIALKGDQPNRLNTHNTPLISRTTANIPFNESFLETQNTDTTQTPSTQKNRRFNDFRNLLSIKKKQLNVLNGLPEQSASQLSPNMVDASPDVLNDILSKMNIPETRSLSFAEDVQSIKNQIQNQLTTRSSTGHDLTIASEDSDAIDMIGMLLDSAVKNLKSKSTTSQLLSMLQAPLISVALKDKSFFDNSIHPARKLLETLTETGMNWLDVNDRDEKLYNNVTEIVSNLSKNFSVDNKSFETGYEKTNELLQSLLKKAEAIERRQIEIAKGKERLGIARMRAEETIEQLTIGKELTDFTKSILLNAWTDVLVLTELRHGIESSNWQVIKQNAEKIIVRDNLALLGDKQQTDKALLAQVQESLQLAGYHIDESIIASHRLLHDDYEKPTHEPVVPKWIVQSEPKSSSKKVFELNDKQKIFVEQIKNLPFGTWFEFYAKETGQVERRKMAWVSKTTHHMLFVNARGQKINEMLIEELAINLSLGFVSIPKTDSRGFIERALDSAYISLKELLPVQSKASNE